KAVCRLVMPFLMLPSADTLAVAAVPAVLIWFWRGARSLATSWETRVGMSRPEPMVPRDMEGSLCCDGTRRCHASAIGRVWASLSAAALAALMQAPCHAGSDCR